MKLLPVLALAIFLSGCNSPQRFEANRTAAQAWLSSKAGTARSNVTGAWHDATQDDWGDARLVQRGNKITGTLGNYEVDGVMNGSRVFFALKADDWYYTKRQQVLYYTSRLGGLIKDGWPDDYLSWESGGSRN